MRKKKIIKVKKSKRRRKTITLNKKNCRTCYKFPCYAHTSICQIEALHSPISRAFKIKGSSITGCPNWEGKTLEDYEIGKVCPVCEGRGRVSCTLSEICNSEDYKKVEV